METTDNTHLSTTLLQWHTSSHNWANPSHNLPEQKLFNRDHIQISPHDHFHIVPLNTTYWSVVGAKTTHLFIDSYH